jgi:hypothetical protein
MLGELDVAWDPVVVSGFTVIAGGQDTLFSWSLRKMTQTGTTIATQSIACGDTAPDLCSDILGLALTQQIPSSIWELPSMPRTNSSFMLPNAPDPGEAFEGGLEVTLLGLDLADRQGTWPASYNDPSITWLDHDADGPLGVTSNIPVTGDSTVCKLPYGPLPIPSDGESATRVYTGSRSLANLSGTIADCNTVRGTIKGPKAGFPQLEGHVYGCMKQDGSACTADETASIDANVASSQRVTGTRFTLMRVPDTTTCAQARALTFP